MNEVWKDVKGYEGLYQVSSEGRIKSLSRIVVNKRVTRKSKEKILKPGLGKAGYFIIILSKDLISKTLSVHRLEAITFISNPDNLPEVNHKDGNKQNNDLLNLEWSSKSNNQKHAVAMGLSIIAKGADCYNAKAVIMKTVNGIELNKFDCIINASKATGINRHSIQKNLSGRNKTAYGYIFEYTKVVV